MLFKYLFTLTMPPAWVLIVAGLLIQSWYNITQNKRIIPLHKDWRDFGKPKALEDDFEEVDDSDEEDWVDEDEEEEVSELQSEYNTQISDCLSDVVHKLYWDEANAISYDSEVHEDNTITIIVKYKPL
jgi:hypothetical protein